MDPAVMLGQDLSERAGPVSDGAVADLAAGDRKLGYGHEEAAGRRLGHLPLGCHPCQSDLARCSLRTHDTRHESTPGQGHESARVRHSRASGTMTTSAVRVHRPASNSIRSRQGHRDGPTADAV